MPRVPIPLGAGSYESISPPYSAQRCVNMYAAIAQAQALNESALFSTPGVVSFSAAGARTLPSRGAVVMAGIYYAVLGEALFSFDSAGVATSLGAIAGATRVSMAHNGLVLCIVVPGGNAYTYTAATTTLAQITDGDYQVSDTVSFKDGYFIFTATAGSNWFVSALNDPSSIDALDFGSAELNPDKIIASHVDHDEVYILGEETTEVFQNIGGSGFPFQRIPGASFEKGVHSKYSAIEWENDFYFVGGGKNEKSSIFRAGGSTKPVKVSTDAIDYLIQKFTSAEIAESYSFSYSIAGSSFVGFTFRSVNIDSRTFVYNVTASRLSERNVWFEQQTGITTGAWRPASIDFVYSKLLVSDFADGRIGYLSDSTYTEYGATILREKIIPPISVGGDSIYIHGLELTPESGTGLISGQGSNPLIMMDYSDDGARTWVNESWKALGASGEIGQYSRRVVWRRLGRAPAHRVFRFRVSDPIKVVFIKLEADVSYGR